MHYIFSPTKHQKYVVVSMKSVIVLKCVFFQSLTRQLTQWQLQRSLVKAWIWYSILHHVNLLLVGLIPCRGCDAVVGVKVILAVVLQFVILSPSMKDNTSYQ